MSMAATTTVSNPAAAPGMHVQPAQPVSNKRKRQPAKQSNPIVVAKKRIGAAEGVITTKTAFLADLKRQQVACTEPLSEEVINELAIKERTSIDKKIAKLMKQQEAFTEPLSEEAINKLAVKEQAFIDTKIKATEAAMKKAQEDKEKALRQLTRQQQAENNVAAKMFDEVELLRLKQQTAINAEVQKIAAAEEAARQAAEEEAARQAAAEAATAEEEAARQAAAEGASSASSHTTTSNESDSSDGSQNP
jgi:DNA polymerase III delta prime subunit